MIGQRRIRASVIHAIKAMSILDTECLKLNKKWLPIGVCTVRKAFEDMAAGAVTGLKFHDGYPTAYRLADWMNLPVPDKEEFVGVQGKGTHEIRKIAVPRVTIAVTYDQLMLKEQPCDLKNLVKRYDSTCAVSKKKLRPHQYSREHVNPRSKGGRNGWKNEVLMDRELNSRRGNKPYKDVGLEAPTILPEPRPLPPSAFIVNRGGYPEWDLFKIPRVDSIVDGDDVVLYADRLGEAS